MYSALNIARYIISKCNDVNIPISNLKLQKLLYFAWADYYKSTQQHLFEDDICAWQFGPVVPNVYYEYSVYGGKNIHESGVITSGVITIDDLSIQVIDKTIIKYARKTAYELVNETHKSESPWDMIFKNGKGNRCIIPFNMIEEECNL